MQKPNTTVPKLLMEKAATYQDRVAMPGSDEFTFTRQLEELSTSIKPAAGMYYVKQPDARDNAYRKLAGARDREKEFRSYMQKQFKEYVQDLRTNLFRVEIDTRVLEKQFRKEADLIAANSTGAEQHGFVISQ